MCAGGVCYKLVKVTTTMQCAVMLVLVAVLPTGAQMGSECSDNRSCMKHQFCQLGYCRCETGYTRGQHYCWPVRKYGEQCYFDVQCVDHRMNCAVNDTGSVIKHCICNRYHYWDPGTQECTQVSNVSALLTHFDEQRDTSVLNYQSEHEMFIKISVVGLIAVLSICIFIVSCIAYGCCSCTRTTTDAKCEPSDQSCPATCPLHKVPLLQQEQRPAAEEGHNKWKQDCPMPASFDDIDIC